MGSHNEQPEIFKKINTTIQSTLLSLCGNNLLIINLIL